MKVLKLKPEDQLFIIIIAITISILFLFGYNFFNIRSTEIVLSKKDLYEKCMIEYLQARHYEKNYIIQETVKWIEKVTEAIKSANAICKQLEIEIPEISIYYNKFMGLVKVKGKDKDFEMILVPLARKVEEKIDLQKEILNKQIKIFRIQRQVIFIVITLVFLILSVFAILISRKLKVKIKTDEELKAKEVELKVKIKTDEELKAKEVELEETSMELALGLSENFEVLRQISNGNLTVKAPEESKIEILATLGKVINEMIEKLKILIGDVKKASAEISSSSTEIASTNTEIRNNAESQLKQITEISTSTTELTASIMQVAGNARNVADAAEKTKVSVDSGYKQTEESLSKIKEAQNMMKSTLSNLFQLRENAKKINEIIESVGKISEKSDLLALNAAIEASGAGEIGKRFRIVADEMRRLADSSINASKETSDILKNIQTSVESNVEYISSVSKSIDEVVSLIEKTGEVLGEVVKVFTNTAEMMKEVSLATNQQVKAIELLNEGMNEINIGTKNNVDGIKQSVDAVNSFLELANKLNELVAEFKI